MTVYMALGTTELLTGEFMSAKLNHEERNQFTTSFDPHKHREIMDGGVRMGDRLQIDPIRGNRKQLKLSRTKLDLVSSSEHTIENHFTKVEIPGVIGKDFALCLELVQAKAKDPSGDSSRFKIYSKTGEPFKLNGNYTIESFVMRGDTIEVGYQKLSFLKEGLKLEDILERHLKVVESNVNIILQGDTGTGKSYLAKEIHKRSGLLGNFVHLNLASLSPNLVESELFGHLKGAFTGALNNKVGAFEIAKGGTLFLDEIDSLSIDLQTKLLLFLDNKKFSPVGSHREHVIDTRLIFASGKDLRELVKQSKMRLDFYYRVSTGLKIQLESLRRDRKKLREIVESFTQKHHFSVSEKLIKHYQGLNWEGNIRQLLGHLELKMACAASKRLDYDEVDQSLECDSIINLSSSKTYLPLRQVQSDYAKKVYFNLGEQVKETSKILEVSPNTLRKLISENS